MIYFVNGTRGLKTDKCFYKNRPCRSSISRHLCLVSTDSKEIIKIIVVSQSRYLMFVFEKNCFLCLPFIFYAGERVGSE